MHKPITLYQFPPARNVPNFSPFCTKVETYLRMMNLEYKTVKSFNPRKGPLDKMPFIDYGTERIGDSSIIIGRLEADSQMPMDAHLNPEQCAELLCVQHMLEEHFYWIVVYSRWCSTIGWQAWSANMHKNVLPPVIGGVILGRIKAQIVKALHAQGIGRFSEQTVMQMGLADLAAINTKLKDRKWYFNDQPATLDSIIFSFLGACLANFWKCPLKDYVLAQDNLMQYYQQIQTRYFPELGVVEKR